MSAAATQTEASPYPGHRFLTEIIAHAVWPYFRFNLSFRDVQDLLAERGVVVSHESVRQWCTKFGATFAAGLQRCAGQTITRPAYVDLCVWPACNK